MNSSYFFISEPRSMQSAPRWRRLGLGVALLYAAVLQTGCSDDMRVATSARAPDGAKAATASAGNAGTAANTGTAPSATPLRNGAGLSQPRAVRFVKLVEVTEWTGKAWAAVAEFNLLDATGAVVDRKGWTATADSAEANDPPSSAIDGNPGTLWHSRWQGEAPMPPHELVIKLATPVRVSGFRLLPRQDASNNGTIARYRFYVSADGIDWGEPVALGDFAETGPPKQERTVIFAEQSANRAPVLNAPAAQTTPLGEPVSLNAQASDPDGDAVTYTAAGLPAGLAIAASTGTVSGTPIAVGTNNVKLTAADNKGLRTSVNFQWNVQPPVQANISTTAAADEVRFVKLEQISEVNGKPWASISEFNLLDAKGVNLPRTGWAASADSADASDKPGNAIDGNPATLWHSQWDGASPPPPHSLIVDLRRYAKVSGFRVLPRQDKLTNGVIGRFRFYTSVDGVKWSPPLAEGDFSTMGAIGAEKTVRLR